MRSQFQGQPRAGTSGSPGVYPAPGEGSAAPPATWEGEGPRCARQPMPHGPGEADEGQ